MKQVEAPPSPDQPRDPFLEGPAHEDIWLYLSGGGIRSALGSVGVIYYLVQSGQWSKVKRITSVSGGTLTNGSLALAEVRDLASGQNRPLAEADEDEVRRWLTATFQRMTWFGHLRSFPRTFVALIVGVVVIHFATKLADRVVDGPLLWLVPLILGASLFQIMFSLFATDRMGYLIGSGRRQLSSVQSPRLHIVATTDVASGEPAYLAVQAGKGRLAHDQSESSNVIRFYDAADTAFRRVVYAASALPFAVLPMFRRFSLRSDLHAPAPPPGSQDLDVPMSGHDVLPLAAPRRWFALMDGGLNSTLGSRLDPELVGLPGQGTMGLIAAEYDLDGPGPAAADRKVLRVVVDAGQYLGPIKYAWLSGVPVLSALLTTHRSIKVSNNSLVSTDRQLADRDDPDVWHLAVTGHDRMFRARYRAGDGRGAVELAQPIGHRFNRFTRSVPPVPDGVVEPVARLVHDLRQQADHVGLFRGFRRYGLGCAASGLVSAHLEDQGIEDDTLDEVVDLLRRFETDMGRKGVLGADRLIGPVDPYAADSDSVERFRSEPARVGPRWPLPGHKNPPLAISHRGVAVDGRRKNTAPAFQAAHDAGFRVLELDVSATEGERPDHRRLAAVHSVLGRVKGHRIAKMSLDELAENLGDEGTDLATLPGLVAGLVSDDGGEGRVLWNVEAKGRHTSDALIHWLDTEPDAPMLVSGGWNGRVLSSVRAAHPTVPTAASLGEALRLLFGRSVPQIAVVQLPWRLGPVARLGARHARRQGIRVHWWTVKTAGQAAKILDRPDCRFDGLLADGVEVLEYLRTR
ncbi:MAG: hypothetical protein GY929_27340 [Actinomycetia bacterium]|nr:hypothetical protein [Actinomycetes bacterium]